MTDPAQQPGACSPADFVCDTCSIVHSIPTVTANVGPGMDFVSAVEAAMEVEHFKATGCRGRIRLAVLVTARSQLAAAEERVERLRGLLRTWLSGHEGMHAHDWCGYTLESPLVEESRKAIR
jgi:hypothetical protein